jgi:hypothetical protein
MFFSKNGENTFPKQLYLTQEMPQLLVTSYCILSQVFHVELVRPHGMVYLLVENEEHGLCLRRKAVKNFERFMDMSLEGSCEYVE